MPLPEQIKQHGDHHREDNSAVRQAGDRDHQMVDQWRTQTLQKLQQHLVQAGQCASLQYGAEDQYEQGGGDHQQGGQN